ncbi:MAG: hypothetical protein MJ252_07940 [archaeon]|nr:hypothetical protein [archaeon]
MKSKDDDNISNKSLNNSTEFGTNEIENSLITFKDGLKKCESYKCIKGQLFKEFTFKDISLKEYLNNHIKKMKKSSSSSTILYSPQTNDNKIITNSSTPIKTKNIFIDLNKFTSIKFNSKSINFKKKSKFKTRNENTFLKKLSLTKNESSKVKNKTFHQNNKKCTQCQIYKIIVDLRKFSKNSIFSMVSLVSINEIIL